LICNSPVSEDQLLWVFLEEGNLKTKHSNDKGAERAMPRASPLRGWLRKRITQGNRSGDDVNANHESTKALHKKIQAKSTFVDSEDYWQNQEKKSSEVDVFPREPLIPK
jgi:hypothetical protein